MPIKILSDDVASQIAAGEVVERPASVVKELVENALDAGADSIEIEVLEAGKQLIEIRDNGRGIPQEELALSVKRHATSKLATAEDLFHIRTLGFRGEALASISSVSHFTITTQVEGHPVGSRLTVNAGQSGRLEPAGTRVGTVVRVEDLFYNIPARRKFLKTDPTERRQIDAFVSRYALAYPHVRFLLKQENRISLQTSGSGDAREVLGALYGADIARQMLEVNTAVDQLDVRGYISPVDLTRGNRNEITFFVNGRWVQDSTLTASLLKAYHTMLMVGRFPIAVLFLEMAPELVDVNVHPTKAEVRFQERDEIFNNILRSVRRALLAYTPVPKASPMQTSWDTSIRQFPPPNSIFWQKAGRAYLEQEGREEEADEGNGVPYESAGDGDLTRQPGIRIMGTPLLRLVGQVGLTYIVAEGPDGLYLIDQHAAHERVLFEKMMSLQSDRIASQSLLEPVTVTLSPSETSMLEGQLPILKKFGFEVEAFGPNTFLLRSLPAVLSQTEPGAALRSVVEEIEEDETPLQGAIEAKVVARVCKRVAVKAGQPLGYEQQKALLEDLEACESPRTCPHGRPTMIHLSIDLLEQRFGRKGAR